MIKVNNLNKYYNKGKSNEIHVLNNISLEFPDTSLVTILGKSGSGKSTLLNVIGLLDKATGEINYNNELEITKYSSNKIDQYRNNNIGYIFQNYSLLPDLTVYENLVYALDLIGITDIEEVRERIDKALDLVNMKNYKKRNVLALSGGQQQRVAIARAIVKGAKVLIADEPTGNLDSANTSDVMDILKSISKTCLVLLVTHDNSIATTYSDRIINLKDGCVVSDEENNSNVISKEFDDKIFIKTTDYKYNFMKYFFSNLLSNFKNTFKNLKKQKLVYLSFILIGFVLSYNIANLNSNLSIDKDEILSNTDYEKVYVDNKDFNFNDLLENELFDNIFLSSQVENNIINLRVPIEYNNIIYVSNSFTHMSDLHYSNLEYKNVLNDDEIIISKYTAEVLLEKISMYKNFNINDLIGYEVMFTNKYYKIVSIENSLENSCVITNVYNYISNYIDPSYNCSMYTKEDAEQLGIVLPEFENYNENKINVYINGNSLLTYNCNVIETNLINNNAIIFATKEDYAKYFEVDLTCVDYELVEGDHPTLDNDVVIPYYLKDTSFEDKLTYNVTGYYELEAGYYPHIICTPRAVLSNNSTNSKSFYTNDIDYVLKHLENSVSYKDYILNNKFENNKNANEAAIITIIVLTTAIIIILFFISRAKMLSKIKVIGIYRALGSSKLKIYLSFLAECIILVTTTTLVGFLTYYLGVSYLNHYIPYFDSYILPIYYLLLSIILIYLLMIFSSLLPIVLLLRKTPIEISAKYDI